LYGHVSNVSAPETVALCFNLTLRSAYTICMTRVMRYYRAADAVVMTTTVTACNRFLAAKNRYRVVVEFCIFAIAMNQFVLNTSLSSLPSHFHLTVLVKIMTITIILPQLTADCGDDRYASITNLYYDLIDFLRSLVAKHHDELMK